MSKRIDKTLIYDCTPAFADVLSGTRPRPEPFLRGQEPDITGYIVEDRILELGPYYQFVTYPGIEAQWFIEQSLELRRFMDGIDSPVLRIGYRYLAALNIDGTRMAVVPLSPNIKSRSQEIWQAAQEILSEFGADVSKQVDLQPLARELALLSHCSYEAAKRHIRRAIRLARNPDYELPQRGGLRDNPGGRPRKEAQP